MSEENTLQLQWERAANNVLAVLLAEPSVHNSRERWDKARYENMLEAYHFPPGQWRMVFEAMEQLRATSDTLHHTLVIGLDARISQDWLNARIALYSELLDGDVFYKHLLSMIDYGETNHVKGIITTAANELGATSKRDEVVSSLMTRLASSGVETISNDTALAAGAELEQYLSKPPSKALTTGIRCIDSWTGGMLEDDVWAIGGAYKMRKSTLARNIALNLARQGASVAILMFESNRRMVVAQFVTMFACEWMRANGFYNAEVGNAKLRWRLSPRDLVRAGALYRNWDKRLVAAINHGILEYKRLGVNLRVYDKSSAGGALSDLASTHRVLLRDKRMYGVDFAVIDHITQINEAGSIYEKMQKASPFLETFSRRHKIALCILAQLNEETVRGSQDNHSPGIKGGGDLPAAVDYLFKTMYREKDEAGARKPHDTMRVVMHLSRYGPGDADEKQELTIDPVTGLIFGESHMVKLNEEVA